MRRHAQSIGNVAFIALVCLGAFANDLSATIVIAFDFPQPASADNTVTGNDAYYFTPTKDITVTALGMYDHDQDGLTQVHTVGLYRVSGSVLLESVDIGGTDGFVSGVFRYLSITDTLLLAGTQYAVSGFTATASGSHAWNPSSLTIAPQIGYDGYIFNLNSSPSLPTGTLDTSQTFFGPGFQFNDVPEPTPFILVGMGLVLIGLYRYYS